MKPPRDHVRLARAFGVAPTSSGFALAATSSLMLIGLATPIGWIAGAGVAVGLGGIAAASRRAVARGLREVEQWGFRVEGYRAWLLADEPTFDIELARDIDVDVIAASVRALDTSIIVSRLGERRVRVVTRRIALPSTNPRLPATLVGDRRLLHELHDRILAPLHADVEIVVMRMGERTRLPLLLPASTTEGVAPPALGAGAFREAALAAPPALQALVLGGSSRELLREARRLDHRVERVVYATGETPRGVGTVLAVTIAGAWSGGSWLGVYGAGLGAVAGLVGGIATAIQANRRNARRVASVYHQPFPIEGYDDWLLSGRPLLDIALHAPCEPGWLRDRLAPLSAFSVGANAPVPWVEDILWIDDQLVRIETRPALIEPSTGKIHPFYGGSHAMFGELVTSVLMPLHAMVGIEAVRMGGYIDRRV